MWSVPPIVGDLSLAILSEVTIKKSNIGTVNINKIGLKGETSTTLSFGTQSKTIDTKPSTYPTNSVPESPKYNFAGG
jgi:hypothetical protein